MPSETSPKRYPEMEGKVALITGGTAGIGLATAQAFAREGAVTVVASRNESRARQGLQSLPEARRKNWFPCDVSDGKAVGKLISSIMAEYGRIDYAFNNAGSGGRMSPVASMSEDSWRKTIDGYLTSVFLCMRHQIPAMLATGGGIIVNNSSVDGLRGYPFPGGAAYAAAKHGVLGLTKSAALEHAKDGLKITAICPGWVNTPATDTFMKKNTSTADQIIGQTPIGRIATPSEIADGVLWLCSNASSFMLGTPLVFDGGYMA